VEGRFTLAAVAILASFVCDGLDGKLARMTRSSSEFGVQLDSLADLVAFGVSPALLVFLWQTQIFGRLGVMSAFLFIACGALRLARFNVQAARRPGAASRTFVGLPIPAAAAVLASLVLFVSWFEAPERFHLLPAICLGLVYLLALLMVSRVRYPAFKNSDLVRAHPFTASVAVVLLFVLVASEPKIIVFAVAVTYLLSGLVSTSILLPLRKGTFLRGLSRQKPS
jgi:CDP-diacylglycerol--serine O-phosphatidyltransferase